MPISRRTFLANSTAATLAAFQTDATPDLAVVNATVHTVDPQTPVAQAFAVKNGRFTAVGSNAQIRTLAGKSTEIIDARGLTAVPGFIDCHNHAPGATLLYDVIVGNPYEVEFVTIAGIIEKLRARAQKTPAGLWVEGFFFDDTKVKDGRMLNIHDLDEVSSEHPVMVEHRGGHTAFFNSKAFTLAGVNKNTPNPSGGTFDHDPATGELNGRVTDHARRAFANIAKRPTFTAAQQEQRNRDALAFISRQFVRYGVTSVHHEGGNLAALYQIHKGGQLLHRVSYEPYDKVLDDFIKTGKKTGDGDEWIRIGATAEFTIDGSFSERTMALRDPYPGITPPYRGNITVSQAELNDWVERVHRAGIQVNCHANGDVAIEMFLTAVERALIRFPRAGTRPKITHCTKVDEALARRMAKVDAVPALFTSYAYYNADKFHFYGPDFMQHAMAFRTLLDAGVKAAAGSDFPPGPFDPRMAIQGMVTRTGWNGETWGANQRISVAEALAVNTINGAYNSHEENVKGSITPGKYADFVLLSDNIFTMDHAKIKDIQIVRTVVGGKTAYRA